MINRVPIVKYGLNYKQKSFIDSHISPDFYIRTILFNDNFLRKIVMFNYEWKRLVGAIAMF